MGESFEAKDLSNFKQSVRYENSNKIIDISESSDFQEVYNKKLIK